MAENPAAALPPKKKMGRNEISMRRWGYFFVSPIMLGTLAFSVGPLFFALYMAFLKWDGMTDPTFIGLQNFIEVFNDPAIAREFWNTMYYTIGVVPPTLIIALVLANFLNAHIPGKTFFRVVYFLPMVTMATAIGMVWKWLYNSEVGLVNIFFRLFGWNPQWLGDPQYIMPAIMIVAVWGGIGYASIITLAGLQGIPRTYYEAADIDGANSWYKFWKLTIPLLSPTIFFLLITSLIGAFKAFDIIFVFNASAVASSGPLTEASRTMVYGVYQKAFLLLRMGYAAAEAAVLFGIILIVTGIQFFFQKKFVFYE